jgi:phosphonoacetaldehyde hydrolase
MVIMSELRAVIFDWAGTAVDFGCLAPVAVFVEVFGRRGVAVSAAEARAPMGLEKRDHIRAVAAQPAVAARWQAAQGRPVGEDAIEAMFRESVALQAACVADYAAPVPGLLEAVAHCRARRMGVGATTGYSRPILEALLPAAARYGYAPDVALCPSDVPAGRPAPWMIFRAMEALGVYPPAAVVKVGDTLPDIAEGLAAGVWAVGVTKSGNELGLTEAEATALPPAELAERLDAIGTRLRAAGAHVVIETVAELPAALAAIEARLARGERP